MEPAFQVSEARVEGDALVLEARGEIDAATAKDLRAALDDAAATGARKVILDLGGVTFVDSRGLTVMVAAHEKLEAGGSRLITVCADPFVRKLFEITGMHRILRIIDSRHDAVVAV
jgi:anti-sigma B factor antagonist